MPMLTREQFDELLPDNVTTRTWTSIIAGWDATTTTYPRILADGLRLMADQTEKDRFAILDANEKLDWKKPDHPLYDPGGNVWPISMHGLSYKDSGRYLTAEGWCLGETCWYVCVEMGWRIYCGAETPELAVMRGMIVMQLAFNLRELAPKIRPHPYDGLKMALFEIQDAIKIKSVW